MYWKVHKNIEIQAYRRYITQSHVNSTLERELYQMRHMFFLNGTCGFGIILIGDFVYILGFVFAVKSET